MSLHIASSFPGLMSQAREAEENGEPEIAAGLYAKAIRLDPHNEIPYNRLMIIYRKLKKFEEELKLINRGIETFEEFYRKRAGKLLSKHKGAERVSTALARSLGSGRKGSTSYPEPIPKWKKRKETVEKKLGKK